ncbi:MAG: aspartate aminotransferase family protein [Clostridiales bacterium]|nr:aspartate aminotransferase family protein [Clostridiales bacterium]
MSDYLLPTYARYPVTFVKGQGCRLWDKEGKEYIDFASGIGVTSVGHAHPEWVAAVAQQAGQLTHTSNLYNTEPGEKLAARLCEIAGMRGAYFANSGAEANEGLIKLARKWSHDKYGVGRAAVLTLEGSFHGRTITTLAATGQEHFHKFFDPFTPGFRHVPAGDMAALERQGDDVCALLLEPIQGEGGVIPLDAAYVQQAAELCRARDWLLLMDEVQTGIGRTGEWFGFQTLGVKPDALSFAKGIAGGLPLGGILVNEKLFDVLGPGDHGSTFGGNPLCCAAALATLDILTSIVPQVTEKGDYIRGRIAEMNLPDIVCTRGRGLMIGIQIAGVSLRELNTKLLEAGLVGLTAGTDALRFLPPLIIENEDIDAGLTIFENIVKGERT